MTSIFLFQCQCLPMANEGILDSEWMASAVAISITFIVFVMGIPAILFQTFIPESLRNIYNERFDNRWANFFKGQLVAVIALFFLSDPMIYKQSSIWLEQKLIQYENLSQLFPWSSNKHLQSEAIVAIIVLISVSLILYSGYRHLMSNFKHTRNIAQQLSKKIANNAINNYDLHRTIGTEDIQDLSVLAKELKAGQTKNQFLEECEKIIEHILDSKPGTGKASSVKKLLEEAVCQSITHEGAYVSEENRLKALEILILVHGHKPSEKNKIIKTNLFQKLKRQYLTARKTTTHLPMVVPDEVNGSDYLHELIGYYVKEVGVAAMIKQDSGTVNEAVENLYTIDADPNELFSLGSKAILLSNTEALVAALQKLKSKSFPALPLIEIPAQSDEEVLKIARKNKRTLHFWLGLLAKIHLKQGAAREYAERQWDSAQEILRHRTIQIPTLFDDTYKHFYRLTDFSTADDVRSFQTYLLKKETAELPLNE